MTEAEIIIRLTAVETTLSYQQKAIEDLSDMVVEQGKKITHLEQQNEMLKGMLTQDVVKPQSEETPPPHY